MPRNPAYVDVQVLHACALRTSATITSLHFSTVTLLHTPLDKSKLSLANQIEPQKRAGRLHNLLEKLVMAVLNQNCGLKQKNLFIFRFFAGFTVC